MIERLCFWLWLVAVFGLVFIVLCFTTPITRGWMGMESAGPLFAVALVGALASLASAVLLRRVLRHGGLAPSGAWFAPAVHGVLLLYGTLVLVPIVLGVRQG